MSDDPHEEVIDFEMGCMIDQVAKILRRHADIDYVISLGTVLIEKYESASEPEQLETS